VVEEPGLRIIQEEQASGGGALPWENLSAFLTRALQMSLADYVTAQDNVGLTFFDRGFLDAVSGLIHLSGESIANVHLPRYYRTIFMIPPWEEIYVVNQNRRHDFSTAVLEYNRLLEFYSSLGYILAIVPTNEPDHRADFVCAHFPKNHLPESCT
jgi:predicted ATPase